MMAITINSRTDEAGNLSLQVPLGPQEANQKVQIIIQRVEAEPAGGNETNPVSTADKLDWDEFIRQTYGSCAGLGLQRWPQGEYEQRDWPE